MTEKTRKAFRTERTCARAARKLVNSPHLPKWKFRQTNHKEASGDGSNWGREGLWLTDKMWRGLHFSYQGSQVRQLGLWVRLAAFIVWPCRWKTCFDFSLENCLSFPCLILCPEFPPILTQKHNGPALEMNEFVSLSQPEFKSNNKLTEKIHDLWLSQRLNLVRGI